MASRRSLDTSAPLVDRAAAGGRIGALLAGESLDTSRLSYDFDVDHVALVAAGARAEGEVVDRVVAARLPHLIERADGGVVWAWLGSRNGFDPAALDALARPGLAAGVTLALGEPGHGLGGWRLTHQQARAALSVALRGGELPVRYGDVALLASLIRDELLSTSLARLFLEPLQGGRDDGDELRRTLRAYFEADRSLSEAAAAIGVTRQAVARRLRLAEKKLGRTLGACGAELETALRFDALATPPSAL